MPDRCVAASCSNVTDPSKGIFVHTIPFFGDSRPEAIKRRKEWVDFVKAKRAKWEPTKHSAVCSVHFKPDDYVFQYVLVPRLKRDKIGIVVFPTVHAIHVDTSLPLSLRCNQNRLILETHHTSTLVVPFSLSSKMRSRFAFSSCSFSYAFIQSSSAIGSSA